MPLKLILMRHMKSSWDSPSDDHARPLNERGRADAPRMGAWLASNGHIPDAARVSSAQRTRETWDGVASAFDVAPQATFLPALYLAEPSEILTAIRGADAQCLALIGHNPGIAEAASLLAQTEPADAKFRHYPTGSTTVFEIDAPAWQDVEWGSGTILAFATPKTV